MGHGIGRTVNLSRTHFNISAEQLNVIALHEPGIAQIARDRNICALCLLSIRIVLLREIPHIVVSLIQGIFVGKILCKATKQSRTAHHLRR